jgi:molybdopterin synthase catalytic subunit
MKLKIRLFATLKDRAGSGHIEIEIPTPATVESLLTAVSADYPSLALALPTTLVAVNKAFASPHTPIEPGDEVAFFPPVSGGSHELPYPTYFAISEDAPDIQAIHNHLTQPDVGAIVTFTGSVRGQTQRDGLPPQTIYLEYEAYNEMAEAKMAQIAQEIWQRWPQVKGIAIVQRIGKLDVGDSTTFVACAAGHRDQGVFDAARYGIDRLKEIVPVWKKEVGPNKSVWVEGHYQATERDNLEAGG